MSSNENSNNTKETLTGWHNWTVEEKRALLAHLRKRRLELQTSDSYQAFRRRYFYDLAGAARDCITWPSGEGLAPYQIEAMEGLIKHRRYSIRGPHGPGKTTTAALITLLFALTRDGMDWKIPVTASKWRQLIEYFWPEVHKWARRIRWDVVGRKPFTINELQTLHLILTTGRAFAVASDDAAAIEGAHADQILYVFDEAKTIPDPIWNAAEGALVGEGSYALAISTPGNPSGRFYDIHRRADGLENWTTRRWSTEEAVASGRMQPQWIEDMRRLWGETSTLFLNRVLGEFAQDQEGGLIPLAWVEAAVERWYIWRDAGFPGALVRLGVDVGLTHDLSVFAPLYENNCVGELEYYGREDPKVATMVTAGRVVGFLRRHGAGEAIVDANGIGVGVYNRVVEQGYSASPFIASEGTDLVDRTGTWQFVNKRSAGWWTLREMFDPIYEENIAIPPDNTLIGDLTAVRYRQTSGGKIRVEEKSEIHKRINRSTDAGDALMQAFWYETVGVLLR